MKLGRVLLLSALVHGALLLAPIPHPTTKELPAAPPLVWMQIVPASPVPSPRPAAFPPTADAIAAPAVPSSTPAPAPSASTRTNIRARAFPDARARATPAPLVALAGVESAEIVLPPGDAGDASPVSAPLPSSGHVPSASGSLLPGPLTGHASVLPPGAVPSFDARAYGEHVRQRIDAHKQYPPRARRLGLDGVVTVIVAIDARGHLARSPLLARSSGVAALDDEALRMARAAAPFPPPSGTDARPTPLVLHVPVRFSLTDAP